MPLVGQLYGPDKKGNVTGMLGLGAALPVAGLGLCQW